MSVRSLYTTTSLLSVDNEKYFVIDAQSRSITPPSTFKNFGVESDENSNRVYFKCPRYVGDSLDLTTLNLRVNYQNAKGDKDQYIVTDVTVEGDNVIFSWLLSRKCTMYSGILSFIVCAVKTDSSGVIVNEWNTTLCTGAVLGGLEVENPVIPEDVTDLVSQLVDIVNGSIADLETAASESVANVKTAEAQAIEAVSKAPNSLFANAVKGFASGEVIKVEDVSPVEHTVGVWVHSKNILNPSAELSYPVSDVYLGVNCGRFIGQNIMLSLSLKRERTVPVGIYFGFVYRNIDSGKSSAIWLISEDGVIVRDNCNPLALVDIDRLGVCVYPPTRENWNAIFEACNVQLELGYVVTDYEPCVDPSTVTLSVCGEDESNAVTYTPDSYGNVNAVSVAPAMTLFTDTEGVTVECEYTKDTNKVIESLIERITELESGV